MAPNMLHTAEKHRLASLHSPRLVTTRIRYRSVNDDAPPRAPFWEAEPLRDTLADVVAGIAIMAFVIAAGFWLMVLA